MKVTLKVNDHEVGAIFERVATRYPARAQAAMQSAAQEIAQEIESLGRADIEGAGNFGSRWTDGFHAVISGGGNELTIDVTEDVPYWTVFQYGATINGKPLLWIPLSEGYGGSAATKGVRARDYPGRLFRVDRTKKGGAPLLMDWDSKQPRYFGKESVTIPKKFHLKEISDTAAQKLPLLWRSKMKGAAHG